MVKRARLDLPLGGSLILFISQALTLYVAFQEKDFVQANQFVSPQLSLELPLVYFLGAAVLLGVVLFLVPVAKLRVVLRIMFALLFSWGMFIVFGLYLPIVAASVISCVGGLTWLFRPRIWLHNLVMIFTMVSVVLVFGFLLSPWTAMSFMLLLSIYDILAVRFGYMLWLAKRLSESDALPAFIIPKRIPDWNLNLREADFKNLTEEKAPLREFSILGGGDVGFPLLLIVSVFFAYGFTSSLIVAAFALAGLASAYWIQLLFLKGKPMPALPPISFASLIGFLIVLL